MHAFLKKTGGGRIFHLFLLMIDKDDANLLTIVKIGV